MQGNFDPITFNMMLNMMNVMYPNMGYNPNNFNNNTYNSAALMNMMMNWINMNPILLQMYNNNMFQNNNINFNNNNNMNFNNNNQIKVNGGGIDNNTPNINVISQNSNDLQCNVAIITQVGKKIMMVCPYTMKVKDFLLKCASRMGFSGSVIGKGIFFIYNGLKINENDDTQMGHFLQGTTNPIFLVVDTKNIIGA